MNQSTLLNKIYLLIAVYLTHASYTSAAVILDFTSRGLNLSTSDVTVDVTNNSVSATGTKDPFLSGGFSSILASGTFDLKISALSSEGGINNFNPVDWSGINDISTSLIATNARGWGVKDSELGGVSRIDQGEAIFFEFDFSGLTLGANDLVVLSGLSGGENYAIHKQISPTLGLEIASVTEEGSVILDEVVQDGDLFALSSTGNRRKFLETLTIDIVTIPEPSTYTLIILGVGALVILRYRLASRGRN
ncbi:MAG: PEP-CTERM sorting domain-containing protein [Verrucomicrobiota bacterium]